MTSDFGNTRYCNICDGEIVREGDAITMYEGKKICRRTKDKPYCIRSRYGTNTKDQNTINAHSQLFGVLRDSQGNSKISEVDYTGKVYCATVPSHTLVIRRNHKTAVVGNCIRYLCMTNPPY